MKTYGVTNILQVSEKITSRNGVSIKVNLFDKDLQQTA